MIAGLRDDQGRKVSWADILRGQGEFSCPRPILRAMAERRTLPPGTISVTEIADFLPRLRGLLDRHDVYVTWQSEYYALFGTAVHRLLHAYADGETAEVEIETELDGIRIVGHPDIIIQSSPISSPTIYKQSIDTVRLFCVLYDYKITSSYAAQREDVKPEWVWQLSLYRFLLNRKGIDISDAFLVFFVRDWKKDMKVPPIFTRPVVMKPPSECQALIQAVISEYLALQDLPEEELPPCPQEKLWVRSSGMPMRCAQYCPASEVCEQWKITQEYARENPQTAVARAIEEIERRKNVNIQH